METPTPLQLKIPSHIAMIMDGNGRWAKARGNQRLSGHKAGAETVDRVLHLCEKYGVRYLTLYAFSTENWSRPRAEVDGLMALLSSFIKEKEKELIRSKCRFRVMGRKSDLSAALQKQITHLEEVTSQFERELIICLSYGGRAEIVDAAKKIAEQIKDGFLSPSDITEALFANNLYLSDVPDPELVIRTSGESRLSNFLLWEAAYSEIYITKTLWPDFNEDDFRTALENYSQRTRKFGGVVE